MTKRRARAPQLPNGLIVRQELSAIQRKTGWRCELTSQRESRNCHRAALREGFAKTEAQLLAVEVSALFRLLRHKLDPLDREILERTFDATLAVVKGDESPVTFDSDEDLEAILRRELIAIACFNGVSDPENLRDLLLDRLQPVRPAPTAG